MTDRITHRDFFISFNSADLAFAEAIDAALRAEGFTTFYHPRDLPPGGNIAIWMDDALLNSAQTLALYSPDYTKDKAAYSRAERYATWWQDPVTDRRKLIPVLLRETTFTPLMAPLKQIDATGMNRAEAAAHVVEQLRAPREVQQRNLWRTGLPLPKVFRAAYRSNPNFAGRFDKLELLQQLLRAGTAAGAIAAITGMGGSGKTTLAAEYCHRLGGRYGGVWWIRAEQEADMLADLQALGERLGIVSSQNVEIDARAPLNHLASITEPWLLVYDNAPSPDAVRKWLPTGAVRCLITSRITEFGDLATVIRLDDWSDEMTADYLLSRTGRNDAAGAARLVRRLGGLPLAAEQAAVYLGPRAGLSFDDYAADVVRLIERPRPEGATGDYPDTVYAAFMKSLEAVAHSESGEIALDLLRLCSFLSPDGVELALLVESGREFLPASLAVALIDKFTRADALAALTSLSLLRHENGSEGPVVIFHRLLLEVARDWMGEHARAIWSGAAVQLVNSVFPQRSLDDPSEWPTSARLMPHVAPLEAYTTKIGEPGRALDRLLNQAGLYLKARGDREGALNLVAKSVKLKRLTRAEEPLQLAIGLTNLGLCYNDLDRLEEAEAAHREALEIKQVLLDPTDPSVATSLSNLGLVYLKGKHFPQAESLLLRALEIEGAAQGTQSEIYGRRLSNLGALYSEWADDPGQAARRAQEEEYKTRALAVTRVTRGERHPATAIRYHNLAVMKMKMRDWPRAAAEAARACAIMHSLDLAQHPNTHGIARDLAEFWEQSGQPDKAARLRDGKISDLLPIIAEIETGHRAWVAEDPETRHFGPPSLVTLSHDNS
jgi:tetratricopeptide (TPR) repeat protein